LRIIPKIPLTRCGMKNQTFFILAISFKKKTTPNIKAEISTMLTVDKRD
jgi:hypothetical protein